MPNFFDLLPSLPDVCYVVLVKQANVDYSKIQQMALVANGFKIQDEFFSLVILNYYALQILIVYLYCKNVFEHLQKNSANNYLRFN